MAVQKRQAFTASAPAPKVKILLAGKPVQNASYRAGFYPCDNNVPREEMIERVKAENPQGGFEILDSL
jgi:hypothetical protein